MNNRLDSFIFGLASARTLKAICTIFILSFVIVAFSSANALSAPTVENVKMSIAVDKNLVFYVGKNSGLEMNVVYEVYSSALKLGDIQITRIENTFTMAQSINGHFAPYEGMVVTLKPQGGSNETVSAAPSSEIKKGKLYEYKIEKQKEIVPKKEKKPEKKPKKEKKEKKEKKPEKKKEVKKQPLPEVKPAPKPARKKRTNHFMLRGETYSAETSPDATFTAVASTSSIKKNAIFTMYGMYVSSTGDDSDDITGLGVNYTMIFPDNLLASLGFGYMTVTTTTSADNNYTNTSFSLSKFYGMKKPSYYKLSAGYSTRNDGDLNGNKGENYWLGFNYYMKRNRGHLINLGYKYTYSMDLDEQLFNKYSADYSFPWGGNRGRKVTLGYQHVEKPYITGNTENTDDIFRLTLTFTN